MKRKPTPTIEAQRKIELAQLCGGAARVDRLLSMWKCSQDQALFVQRATEAGFSEVAINLFLKP